MWQQIERVARVRTGIDERTDTAIFETDDETLERPIAVTHHEAATARLGKFSKRAQRFAHDDPLRPALPSDSSTRPRRIMKANNNTPGSAARVVSR